MIRRVVPSIFALFVAGGLLSGILALDGLTQFAAASEARESRDVIAPTGATATAMPPSRSQSNPALATPAAPVTPVPPPSANGVGKWSLLYVIDGDLWETSSDAPVRLTHNGHIGQPALGESALAFVERSRDASDIWLASASGPPRAITRNTAATVAQNHWATQPVFLPGPQRLYMLADFNKASTGVGALAVWERSVDQTPAVQITRPQQYSGGDQDVTVDPHDPRHIIFTRYVYAGVQLVEQIQWLDVSSDSLTPLTPADQPSRQASYSPDATELAYAQHADGGQENLFVAHLQVVNGAAQLRDPRQVATGVVANPVWSPDGQSLAYIALANDRFQIWSVGIQRDANGMASFSEPQQVTTGISVDATSRPVYLRGEQAEQIRQWLALYGL